MRERSAALNGRGSALQKLHRIAEAEQELRRAIQLKPDYAEAYCNLGTVHIDLGKLLEAEALIRRAVELRPNNIAALCNLARVLVDLGRPGEAEAYSSISVKRDSGSATTSSRQKSDPPGTELAIRTYSG